MLTLGNEPLLAYMMRYLARNGICEVAINLHFKADVIRNFLGEGTRFGLRIHYSYEEVLLGTAGAAKNIEDYFLPDEDFLVVYGDLLLDQPLQPMLDFHRRVGASATLLLHRTSSSNSLVQLNDDWRITHFIERPSVEERGAYPFEWANSGLQILNRRVLEFIPAGRSVDFPKDVYAQMVDIEPTLWVYGFPLSGYRCAIDSPRRYLEAQQAVESGLLSLEPSH
jgi:NDP-sugar pyrophosphorylase family protein